MNLLLFVRPRTLVALTYLARPLTLKGPSSLNSPLHSILSYQSTVRGSFVQRTLNTSFQSFSGGAAMSGISLNRPGKKIIVGCDGTWLNSDSGRDGQAGTPSNVTRLCRALEPRPPTANPTKAGETDSGVLQLVDYHPGIGSSNNPWDHYVNGATAASIGDNVNQAYASIVEKYVEGDEIFLLGFSRGSFIARSICAMIADVGLLNKKGMEFFYDVFQDWENQNIPEWTQRRYSDKSFKDANDGNYSSYTQQLEADGLVRVGVRIKALACFDTVGSLGVPTIGWKKPTRTYAFVNTEPSWNVDNCFHAMALDECRVPFSPTLWELPDSRIPGPSTKYPCDLRQCWFPGVHSNIGGSVEDAELPDISLAWMITQLSTLLDFDDDYLRFCQELNVKYYKSNNLPQRKWGMGYISNPMTAIQRLGGSKARTPGRYCRTDPETGRFEDKRLENTNEKVHPAVRIRRYNKAQGKGVDDVGTYDPPALKGFKLKNSAGASGTAEYDPRQAGFTWEYDDPVTKSLIVLEEDKLGDVELTLLDVTSLAPTKKMSAKDVTQANQYRWLPSEAMGFGTEAGQLPTK